MRHDESRMQTTAVRWFDYTHPELSRCLLAVPNGGARSKREAGILKSEGVRAGAADLILLTARGGHGSLCIEFKTKTGRQSPAQKEWQKAAENAGNRYVVCRSFEEFQCVINEYLK